MKIRLEIQRSDEIDTRRVIRGCMSSITRCHMTETNGPHESRAVVANRNGHGCVLFYRGDSITIEIEECCLHHLGDLGLDDAPDGISIWEGAYIWHSGGYEYPQDGSTEPSGKFRSLTEWEWGCVKCGQSPFDPPDEITRSEWDAHREALQAGVECPCDNHPALSCETCRGACGCHFKTWRKK